MSYPPPPPPLNYAPYGGPPKKNRAGLVIVLLIGVVVACVGAAGYIAYDLASSRDKEPKATEQTDGLPVGTPSAKPSPRPSVTKPVVKPTAKPTVRPSAPKPTKTVAKPVLAQGVALSFVANLNVGRPAVAVGLACVDTREFVRTLVDRMIGSPTNLVIGAQSGVEPTLVFQLSGTTKGKQAAGVVLIDTTAAPCVKVINVGTF